MGSFLTSLEADFKSAMESNDIASIESILVDFDKTSKEAINSENDVVKKEELIRACIRLHDEFELSLLTTKKQIQEQMHSAKTNGKKINKYLNV